MNKLWVFVAVISIPLTGCRSVESSARPDNVASAATDKSLFAVEIKTGPNWDHSKAPNEQAFFAEHSANLRSLRQAGYIVMGARYSDIGLIVFTADSADQVKALMNQDPAMTAGTFRHEVHAMTVFYPGLVQRASAR